MASGTELLWQMHLMRYVYRIHPFDKTLYKIRYMYVQFLLMLKVCTNLTITYIIQKDNYHMNSRKLMMVDAILDYNPPGANTRHDQGRGKPGGGTNP